MTATPLHTSPTDLYNIGAMVRIPALASESGYHHFEGLQKEVARVKKMVTQDDIESEQEPLLAMDNVHADSVPTSANLIQVRTATMQIVKWVSDAFHGRIIRRTASSKDWEGNLLNKLDPYQHEYVCLELSDEELQILHEIQEDEACEGCVNQVLNVLCDIHTIGLCAGKQHWLGYTQG